MLDDCGKVLEVLKQRPQDQGLLKTSAGSPARSASPSSGSGSSASYRKTRKASSPSSIVCFSALSLVDVKHATCLVGDTPLEETVESDSERRE
ncbi:hypothetical protein Taro_036652 [Colocasia esculenta]|uniref:Uncharacterized protein n=1 Tax=Colocasia esculenta TaxID=4460 RepID=A0A843WIG7_COLES|nr:hypothetical protein [Colocasia esculenta]